MLYTLLKIPDRDESNDATLKGYIKELAVTFAIYGIFMEFYTKNWDKHRFYVPEDIKTDVLYNGSHRYYRNPQERDWPIAQSHPKFQIGKGTQYPIIVLTCSFLQHPKIFSTRINPDSNLPNSNINPFRTQIWNSASAKSFVGMNSVLEQCYTHWNMRTYAKTKRKSCNQARQESGTYLPFQYEKRVANT
jgi:predicted RNA binding protein YcfA (HicA-like mRNA interferase family)